MDRGLFCLAGPLELNMSCLRTVDESVQRHSQLLPGETSYIDFVGRYLI